MADVTIDGTVSTSTARGMRSVVFTTDQIGYWFYIDSAGTFVYSKTTNGGAAWGAAVTISAATTNLAFDVWFDQWTPLDTGTVIHTWYLDTTVDDALYRTLNTTGDSLGTQRVVFAGATAVAGRGVFISGTKTRSGYLYCAYDMDAGAEKGLHRSTDGGTTWSANLATTFVEATLDEAELFPASNTGDDNDCWAIYKDTSALAMTLKMWDSSAAAEVESATIQTIVDTGQATDLTGQFGYSASVRHSDGHLIFASISDRDTATSDHQVWDLNGTASITAKTAITTNIDDHWHPQVFIDQQTDHIYVAYNGLRDGSQTLGTTTNVYYTKSTDGGTTWTAGNTAYRQAAAGAVIQIWAPLTGPRLYVGWRVGTTLLGNAVNSLTFVLSFASLRQALIDGMTSAQSEGTGWNAVVKPAIPVANVVRTSGTVATITIPAASLSTYDITSTETVTVTVPSGMISGWGATVASPPFNIEVSRPSKGIRRQLQAVNRSSYY